MTGALETIEYLARSANRLAILAALAADPHDRSDLQASTGTTRPTLGRILSELVDRDLVERRGGTYHATPLGTYLANEFTGFVRALDAVIEVSDVISLLPDGATAFGIDRFASASITTASVADPLRPVREAIGAIEEADLLVMLTPTMTKEALQTSRRAVRNGQRFDAVFTRTAVDAILADEALRAAFEDILAAESATAWVVDEPAPCIIWYLSDVAGFGLSDASGAPKALVRTADPVLFGWVQTTICEYRSRATPLGPGSI